MTNIRAEVSAAFFLLTINNNHLIKEPTKNMKNLFRDQQQETLFQKLAKQGWGQLRELPIQICNTTNLYLSPQMRITKFLLKLCGLIIIT